MPALYLVEEIETEAPHCLGCQCHASGNTKARAMPKVVRRALPPPLTGTVTPAKAAKYRRLNAELCGCVLCVWSLNPTRTFEEHSDRMAETERRNNGEGFGVHKTWADLRGEQ